MNPLSCQVDLQARPVDKPLTVGDRFLLSCGGEVSPLLNKSNLRFRFEKEEEQYALHLLAVKDSSANNLQLVVTSYRPGNYSNYSATLTDGAEVIALSGVTFQVNSILKQDEEPKPVGSFGPFELAYPVWLWIALASTIVLIALGVFFGVQLRRRRQRLRQELESFATMLSPFNQFSRDMRILLRQMSMHKPSDSVASYSEEIEKLFRLYLIREFLVPALQASDRVVLKILKKEHSNVYKMCQADIKRMFSEFVKAKKDIAKVKLRDCEELGAHVRQVVEKLYLVSQKRGR